ncbi:hypothetical protein Psuf_081530 [Phytohabitans suffuscus]|uniref:Uncharacterized protein n=1 Tax=Phytohabitans suffuscus TaxID=624315 RepID=A0A6F8YXE7_9ACTN|nr:hypothetical protein [Phytohabitans suffuscus]BCB90840.1 hypothetical protein Psuf_081530 [Phytohabitans suffuscus]
MRLGGGGGGDGDSGYRVDGRELTEGEFRYGLAPRRHDGVTLQPDVVLVEGGAGAVRSVTADGLTWTIDAGAKGAADLVPGKVMFATARGVGRVVDARRSGDTVAVTIAPVSFTEVVRDGTFASGDDPVPLDGVVSYSSEGALWTDPQAVTEAEAAQPSPAGRSVPLRRAPADRERVEMPRPVAGAPKSTSTNGFTVTPTCCAGGVGARLRYDDNEIRIEAGVLLKMNKPSARFHLAVAGGRITAAELQVYGGAGIKVDVSAASAIGHLRQLDRTFTIPIDFSVPVGLILGIPFTLSANQEVLVKTAFSAKNGNVRASGEYAIDGTLGFGYRDGGWGAYKIGGPHIKSSLLDSVRGVSVGANGIVLDFKTTFRLGIGALGFSAGLNFGIVVSTGVARGSALAQFFPLVPGERSLDCRGASLTVDTTYNVGYTIPAVVQKVVNFFLRVFNAKPIARSGGVPDPPARRNIFSRAQYEPKGCQA